MRLSIRWYTTSTALAILSIMSGCLDLDSLWHGGTDEAEIEAMDGWAWWKAPIGSEESDITFEDDDENDGHRNDSSRCNAGAAMCVLIIMTKHS